MVLLQVNFSGTIERAAGREWVVGSRRENNPNHSSCKSNLRYLSDPGISRLGFRICGAETNSSAVSPERIPGRAIDKKSCGLHVVVRQRWYLVGYMYFLNSCPREKCKAEKRMSTDKLGER